MAGAVDVVYDRYMAVEKLKKGTKYERMAAIVFCVLEKQTVVHDLRLTGTSGVAHQIDAVVGPDHKRIIIEAKDYTKSVGLGTVRDFFGVVEDLRPDGAYVVTTEGFTGPAKKYTEAKGIRLGILRVPRDADLDGLVQSMVLTIDMMQFKLGPVSWQPAEPDDMPEAVVDSQHRVWSDDATVAYADGTTKTLTSALKEEWGPAYAAVPLGEERELGGVVRFDRPAVLSLPGNPPISVSAYKWEGRVTTISSTSDITPDVTPELVFIDGHDGTKRVFTDKDLSAVTLNP